MTLAEAIAHEDWAATTAHGELAAEHAQMRDWLRELERLRTENARLRSELESVGTAAYLYGRGDLKVENAKLRELCSELLRMAESNDPDFLHWPEIHDELRKVGVEIVQL